VRNNSILVGNWSKLAAPLLIGSVVAGILAYVIASRLLIATLGDMEREAAKQAGMQITSALAMETQNLERMTLTYSEWSDAYNFVEGKLPDFIDANFAVRYLESIDIDYVWVFDNGGHLVGSASREHDSGARATPVRAVMSAELQRTLGSITATRRAPPSQRFVFIDGKLLSLGLGPIRRDDLTGDAGTIVLAHHWTPARLSRLGDITQHPLQLVTGNANELGRPAPIEVAEVGKNRFQVHVALYEPAGRAVASMHMPLPRDMMRAASRTTQLVICAVVAGFLLLVALLAQRLRRSEQAIIAHQHKLADQAKHDALTGLPNRGALADLREQVGRSTPQDPSAIYYIDIDRFKSLNDSLGHGVGDDILRTVAQRLRAGVSRHDTVVRLGGDEFLVLAPGIGSRESATKLARRMRASFDAPMSAGEHQVQIGLSIGVAMAPIDAVDLESAIRCADLALYQAKERGKNCHQLYDPELGRRQNETRALGDALEVAIRDQQIHLEYQPQYAVDTGELVGMEALARWTHPDIGNVPPSRFIALAEQNGLIDVLGEQVIRKACRQMAEWRSAGGILRPVSVNLSARQFDSGSLVDFIITETRNHDIAPQQMVFEITESVLMKPSDGHAHALQQLRAAGFRIAIDDFGTGYSSLAYLRLYPVSTIKIDRSFVRDLTHASTDGALVKSVLDIARHFGLQVVAEGVETAEQLERLRELHCDTAQGYFLNRPLSPANCLELLLSAERKADPGASQRLLVIRN
jgi:diguanylate cyclase (GGDEF)-like protein